MLEIQLPPRVYRVIRVAGKRAAAILLVWLPYAYIYKPLRGEKATFKVWDSSHGKIAREEAVAERPPDPVSRWGIGGLFERQDSADFQTLLQLLAEMVAISYSAPPGYYYKPQYEQKRPSAKFTGGGSWTRVAEVERLTAEGLSVVVAEDELAKRILIAFRGSCLDPVDSRCMQDYCASWYLNGGDYSWSFFDLKSLYGAFYCWYAFSKQDIDYLSAALEVTRRVHARRPKHAFLLTGHALGALLALTVGAKLKMDSVTMALPRIDLALGQAQLDVYSALDDLDVWSLHHPHDPDYIESLDTGGSGFAGVETCVFAEADSPEDCVRCMLTRDRALRDGATAAVCAEDCFPTHSFKHYLKLLLPKATGERQRCYLKGASEAEEGFSRDVIPRGSEL
eukprot:TRINITY_DN54135_c0_g1_i1.p1 TRINITY_DN54135_c0_g1~~TRINITY_DN54135_c0_g1_i1.p1  ORF type:complete len:395 (+),score=48.40 TRINITY_DN54135_c0_g1_i1:95-1279(+)